MMQMSEAMKRTLINAGTSQQGAKVWAGDSLIMAKLAGQGLIGPGGGLTRKGSIARERLMTEALDKAFG